jgi:hypothetical protein
MRRFEAKYCWSASSNKDHDERAAKITLGEMRETGVRDPIVICADYKCGHNIKLASAVVDWDLPHSHPN